MTNAEKMRLVSKRLAEITDTGQLLTDLVAGLEQELHWREQLARAERLLSRWHRRLAR